MNKAMLELHLATALFGLAGVLAQMMTLDATEIVIGRTALGALYAFVILRWFKQEHLHFNTQSLIRLVILGILLALHWWSFFYTIKLSSVAIGLLTFSSFPLFTAVLAPFITKNKTTSLEWLTILGIFLGIIILIPFDQPTSSTLYQGIFWGLFSGLSFSLIQIFNQSSVKSSSPQQIAFVQNTVACLVFLPFLNIAPEQIDLNNTLLLIIMGILCTGLAHTLLIKSLSKIKAQTASITIGALEPIYGIILALFILYEIPETRTIIGGTLIILTIITTSLLHKRKSNKTIS